MTFGDVFIVGAPRSGTTWLQAVLSQHPSFASPPETEIFMALGEIDARYRAEGRRNGIGRAIGTLQFEDWCADLWRRTRRDLLAAAPGSSRILEKSPDHARHIALIRRLVPGARFIHLVRHPADVVRSTLEASEGWGHDWASPTAEIAAGRWMTSVSRALDAAQPDDTLMVRYEDLLLGPAQWRPLLDFIGIETTWPIPPLHLSPAEQASFVVPAAVAGDSGSDSSLMPHAVPGFSYHDRSAEQRRELTRYERRYVEFFCHRLLPRVGYPVTRTRLSTVDRIRANIRRVQRVVRRLAAAR